MQVCVSVKVVDPGDEHAMIRVERTETVIAVGENAADGLGGLPALCDAKTRQLCDEARDLVVEQLHQVALMAGT